MDPDTVCDSLYNMYLPLDAPANSLAAALVVSQQRIDHLTINPWEFLIVFLTIKR